MTFAGAAAADEPARPRYDGETDTPRGLTEAERAWLAAHPLQVGTGLRSEAGEPTGPLVCPGEYAPCDGVLFAWEGSTAMNTISKQMIAAVTTTGQAKAYVVFDTTAERDSQMPVIQAAGADMSRVVAYVRTTDTIWIRDYGPRYVYEGDCRVVIDHTYNRPRPNDDTLPIGFAAFKHHALYTIPLIHGGGNFHLDSLTRSHATRLTVNENPQITGTQAEKEAQIIDIWRRFQGVNTTLYDPFPTSVDSTQHIDMWVQVVGDDKVMVSQWPAGSGTQETITESAAVSMAAMGYQVFRLPARLIGGVHYTYSNVVICNNLVLVPTYSNATMVPLNAPAAAVFQAALPGKTIQQINCDALVVQAGVMHCIVMHVPVNKNGASPGVYVRSYNTGATIAPGSAQSVGWISDDDVGVVSVDVQMSLDGGATWPIALAAGAADTGQLGFVAPNRFSHHARVRVVAHDGDGNTGADVNDVDVFLAGTCAADFNGSNGGSGGSPTVQDIFDFLGAWFQRSLQADVNGVGGVTVQDIFDYLSAYFAGC